jgi:hypothetical protein
MRIKSDKLDVRVYARHGDSCSLENEYGHHDSLGCASGFKADDFSLVASFTYLQEAIDYAINGARRGVSMRLVSRIVPKSPMTVDYVPAAHEQRYANRPVRQWAESVRLVHPNGNADSFGRKPQQIAEPMSNAVTV